MVFIETASTDPSVNLAFEEHFLRHKGPGETILMLWRNQPAVVVGRFQNIFAEVNLEYTQTHSIQILRRISGGGAVYHDAGNLCFSLIMDRVQPGLPKAADLLRPMVQALARLGLVIELSQRNDLKIEGKKFSGHALMVQKDRLLLHGTLLFDSNLETLQRALESPFGDLETKAIQSVRSSVTNLAPYLPAIATTGQFKQALKDILFESQLPAEYTPTAGELSAIEALGADKYRSWEWTYGGDPRAHVRYNGRYGGEDLPFTLDLDKGQLVACHFEGDLPRPADFEEIERRLTNVRGDQDSVLAALRGCSRGEFIGTFLARFLPLSSMKFS
jgi:lipoate---protein ligase